MLAPAFNISQLIYSIIGFGGYKPFELFCLAILRIEYYCLSVAKIIIIKLPTEKNI